MLRIGNKALPALAVNVLNDLQTEIDIQVDYQSRVTRADALWKVRTSTKERRAAFKSIRETLAQMCVGAARCAYCEDSLADEIEHICPKSIFPDRTFVWTNLCFACGPCNGPKSNRFGTIDAGGLNEFLRKKSDPIVPPPPGQAAFIDPRTEDPTDFLELDLGGQLPSGQILDGTFEYLSREDLSAEQSLRAEFTIEVLGLNREVIRASRANAFGGFRARLGEYALAREAGESAARLDALKSDLLNAPHLSVFYEMRRQRDFLPEIKALFDRAPAALNWPLIRA